MTTDRSSNVRPSLFARFATPRALGAFLSASLLAAAGCQDHDGREAPTDNSRVVPGNALVKFCHDIRVGDKPITLRVEFGQPTLATISAVSGTCSPPVRLPCTKVPVGTYPGRLIDGTTVLHAVTVDFRDGEEYLLRARVNVNTGLPIVVKDRDFNPGNCTLFDGYPTPDGGGSDGGETDGGADAARDVAVDMTEPDAADAGASD
jgi:hypothetical protein